MLSENESSGASGSSEAAELDKYSYNNLPDDNHTPTSMLNGEIDPVCRGKISGDLRKKSNLVKMRWASDGAISSNNVSDIHNPDLSINGQQETVLTPNVKSMCNNKFQSTSGIVIALSE